MSDADHAAIGLAKQRLRRAVALRRRARPEPQRRDDDRARLDVMLATLQASRPDTVAAYLSLGSEPDCLQLVAWLHTQHIRVLLPVLTDGATRLGAPCWAAYGGPDHLRSGYRSILEPSTTALGSGALGEADLIVCPGVAANRDGDRLGRGGGWYDRALGFAAQSAPVCVLLNADEVLAAIPTEPWDRRVDLIATPTELIAC